MRQVAVFDTNVLLSGVGWKGKPFQCLRLIAADPDDDKVLECAVIGNATHIVSGDKRHLLPLGTYQGIRIDSPAEFLQLVASSSGQQTP